MYSKIYTNNSSDSNSINLMTYLNKKFDMQLNIINQ